MSGPVTASTFRQNIYRLLDEVLESGVPLDVERKGRRLQVVAVDGPTSRLDMISGNPTAIVGDPEELVSIDWTGEWDAERALR